MKIARAWWLGLALLLGVAPGLRAGDAGVFEIHAVALRASPLAREYLLDDGQDPVMLPLEPAVLLDATALASAEARSEDGNWTIAVELNAAGKARFADLTTRFLDRRLAILVAGKMRCAPVVQSAILDGSFEIAGNFTPDEVKALAADLNAAVKKETAPAAPAATATPTAPAATATPGSP